MAVSSTKYLRIKTVVELSRNSDYSSPLASYTHTAESTPTRYLTRFEVLAPNSGHRVLDLAQFGTITQVIVHNRDTTNFAMAAWKCADGGTDDMYAKILAGQTIMIGAGLTIANDLLLWADTAACELTVSLFGTV